MAHPEALHPDETALVNASIESGRWLTERYLHYRHIPQVYAHTPRAMRKSVMHELEHLAGDWFAQVRTMTRACCALRKSCKSGCPNRLHLKIRVQHIWLPSRSKIHA